MKAYLIDPEFATVREVETTGTHANICRILKTSDLGRIDVVNPLVLGGNNDMLYFDVSATPATAEHLYSFATRCEPATPRKRSLKSRFIAGHLYGGLGLVLGFDPDCPAPHIDPESSLSEIEERVRWLGVYEPELLSQRLAAVA